MGCGCSSKTAVQKKSQVEPFRPGSIFKFRRLRTDRTRVSFKTPPRLYALLYEQLKCSPEQRMLLLIFSFLSLSDTIRVSRVSRQFYKLAGTKEVLGLYGGHHVYRDGQLRRGSSLISTGANILIINTNHLVVSHQALPSPTVRMGEDILEHGEHIRFGQEFFAPQHRKSLNRSSHNTAQFFPHDTESARHRLAGLSVRSGEGGLASIVSSLDIANISTPKNIARRSSKYLRKQSEEANSQVSLGANKHGVADSGMSFRFEEQRIARKSFPSKFMAAPEHVPGFGREESNKQETK